MAINGVADQLAIELQQLLADLSGEDTAASWCRSKIICNTEGVSFPHTTVPVEYT